MIFGTFGIYRYILAFLVMAGHVGPHNLQYINAYAVFAFFMLSGYIVSFILQNHYLLLRHGIWKYAVNRALRIYPSYWIVLGFSCWLSGCYPNQTFGYPHNIDWLRNMLWWGTNIFALTSILPVTEPYSLVYVNWSLSNEIVYWALMPLLLINKRIRIITVFAAVCYTLIIVMHIAFYKEDNGYYRYFSPFAASLPFCIGMILFMAKSKHHTVIPHTSYLIPHTSYLIPHTLGGVAILAFLVLTFGSQLLFNNLYNGFYIAMIINALIIGYLSQIDQRKIPALLQKIDSFCGHLTYPLFLLHIPTALLISAYFPSIKPQTVPSLFYTFLLSNIFALLLYYTVEIPVNRLRQILRC